MYKNSTHIIYKFNIFLLLMVTQMVFSQKANELFVEANELYKSEKFAEAITTYHQIEQKDMISVDLYYNLANAYYKTNQVAPAIFYYEKALQLAPNNKDVITNLGFAKQMTIDNIEKLPSTILQKISLNFIEKLTYNSWSYVAVILAFLFAFFFLAYHFSDTSTKKRLYFFAGNVSLILIIFSVIFAFHTFKVTSNKKEAIVFAQQTDIKNAPVFSSETIFKLHEGTKVSVLERVDNWKKIKIADGQTGWIIASELKELN
jgi:tetratricopeptide (TPR) repeat protein